MKKYTAFALFAFCLAFSAPARAVCVGLTLQGVPATATFQGGVGEYSVFDPVEYMQTTGFSVGGGASLGSCNWFVTLGPGSSGNPAQRRMTRGADSLNYNVYTSSSKSNILKDATTAGAGEVISGSFPNGFNGTSAQSLSWTIAPSQVVLAGATQFQDAALNLRLYEGILLGVYLLADTKQITFKARAESSVDLSLVDTGGSFSGGDNTQTVDFGNLVQGAVRSYDTVIRSNDGYAVTFKSANGQVLKHQTASATVPYSVTFGGGAVDLTSGAPVQVAASSGTTTPATGTRFATTFTVGAMTGAEMAGNYQDVITVTVAAN